MKKLLKYTSLFLLPGIVFLGSAPSLAQQLIFKKHVPTLVVEAPRGTTARWDSISVDFGSVTIGQYAVRTVSLFNDGISPADFSAIPVASSVFTVNSSACKNVAPQSSCLVQFTFTPNAAGIASLDNLAPSQGPHSNTLSLQGLGTQELLSLSTDELVFSPLEVGSNPASMSVSILNAGVRNVNNIQTSFTGNFAVVHNCPSALTPNSTCQVTVTYNPQSVENAAGVLTIASSLGSQSVALSAKTIETKAALAIKSGSSADFGAIKVGQSVTRQFTFSNTGSVALTGISPTVDLTTGSEVTVKSTTCSTSLAVGSNCDITLEYKPTAGGSIVGSLKVVSSAKASPHTVAITGSATAVDPQAAQVEFLLRGEGTEGSTNIVDDTGRTTWTVSGTATTRPRISTTVFRSGAGSIYFPGGGNIKSNMNTSLGTGDFTLEFWAYRTAFQNNNQSIIENAGWTLGGNHPGFYNGGYKFSPWAWCTAVNGNCYAYDRMMQAGSAYSVLNVWQHVAVTRQGNTYRMYVNGSKVSESVQTTNFNMDNGASDLRVLIGYEYTGYLDDIRLTKGLARYTGASFVIEQPLADAAPTTTPDANVASVETLSNFEDVNGSTNVIDSTGKYTWSTIGSGSNAEVPVISSNFARFGSTSIYLPGNGRYLRSNQNINLGTGNFTIEFWAMRIEDNGTRPNAVLDTNGWIIGNNNPGFYTAGWRFTPYHWCTLAGQNCGSYGRMTSAGAAYNVLNTWQHIAVTRDGNTWRLYVDGLKVSESIQTNNIDMDNGQSDLRMYLGRNFKGYIDDLRITKGVARYTGNSFVPNTTVTLN